MKPHPADLWKEPVAGPAFDLVRARGMETIHQKRPAEDAALCGLLPADHRRGRWTVYPTLPAETLWCETCWVEAGKVKVRELGLSRTAMQADAAWPFPNHHLKDKP